MIRNEGLQLTNPTSEDVYKSLGEPTPDAFVDVVSRVSEQMADIERRSSGNVIRPDGYIPETVTITDPRVPQEPKRIVVFSHLKSNGLKGYLVLTANGNASVDYPGAAFSLSPEEYMGRLVTNASPRTLESKVLTMVNGIKRVVIMREPNNGFTELPKILPQGRNIPGCTGVTYEAVRHGENRRNLEAEAGRRRACGDLIEELILLRKQPTASEDDMRMTVKAHVEKLNQAGITPLALVMRFPHLRDLLIDGYPYLPPFETLKKDSTIQDRMTYRIMRDCKDLSEYSNNIDITTKVKEIQRRLGEYKRGLDDINPDLFGQYIDEFRYLKRLYQGYKVDGIQVEASPATPLPSQKAMPLQPTPPPQPIRQSNGGALPPSPPQGSPIIRQSNGGQQNLPKSGPPQVPPIVRRS